MSAFDNLSFFFDRRYYTDILPSKKSRILSRYRPGLPEEQYLALQLFPLPLSRLRPASSPARALAPELEMIGEMTYSQRSEISLYNSLGRAALQDRVKELLKNKYGFYLPGRSSLSYEQREKAAKKKVLRLSRLCTDVLRFDQVLHRSPKAEVGIEYDQHIKAPEKTRTPFWHTDGGNQTVYTITGYDLTVPPQEGEPLLTTEYILDCPERSEDPAKSLIEDIRRDQPLGFRSWVNERVYRVRDYTPEAHAYYDKVQAEFREMGLFMQYPYLTLTVHTGRTDHKTAVPEPGRPTPASILIISTKHYA